MTRQAALLRLEQTLQARRVDLHKTLTSELANLCDLEAADSPGDNADAAFAAGSHEISSLLAELDADELSQIERVLTRLQQGVYGRCEGGSQRCQKNIPVARLNALPATTLCINCEREKEKQSDRQNRWGRGNWAQVFDPEAPMKDQRITLFDLEMSLSGNRRE
jgi:DnaK suppressor protein